MKIGYLDRKTKCTHTTKNTALIRDTHTQHRIIVFILKKTTQKNPTTSYAQIDHNNGRRFTYDWVKHTVNDWVKHTT